MSFFDTLITTFQSLVGSDSLLVNVRCRDKLGQLRDGKIICDEQKFNSLNEFGVFAYSSQCKSITSSQFDLITFECGDVRLSYPEVKQRVTLPRGRASENLKRIETYIKELCATDSVKVNHKEQSSKGSDSDTDEEYQIGENYPLLQTGTGLETLRRRTHQHQ